MNAALLWEYPVLISSTPSLPSTIHILNNVILSLETSRWSFHPSYHKRSKTCGSPSLAGTILRRICTSVRELFVQYHNTFFFLLVPMGTISQYHNRTVHTVIFGNIYELDTCYFSLNILSRHSHVSILSFLKITTINLFKDNSTHLNRSYAAKCQKGHTLCINLFKYNFL